MRESRNGYRPVTVGVSKENVSGYLICFGPEGDLQEGIGMFANIELEDGQVVQYDAYAIKFDDIE